MAKKQIDTKYIKQFKKGDLDAFSKIYMYYKDPLFYFILNLVKNPTDAEDVLQETFVQVINKIQTLKKVNSFYLWLYQIAYNNAMQVHRKKSNMSISKEEFPFDTIVDQTSTPNESLNKQELLNVIEEEIQKLPSSYIQVAYLRYFENLTTREIGIILDIPDGTVKSRLKTIREKIQPTLKSRGFSPKTYFSYTIAPIVFQAFNEIVQQNAISSDITSKIYENIGSIGNISLGALGTSSIVSANATSLGLKFILVISLTGTLTAGTYAITSSDNPTIEEISYYNLPTNKNIEVSVTIKKDTNKESVSITSQNQPLDFHMQENIVTFIVSQNGDYKISVNDVTEKITIDTIDKEYPILTQANYQEQVLSLSLSDNLTGIDYNNSYVEYQGNQYSISKEGKVSGEFDDNIIVHVYDQVGNFMAYAVDLIQE
ncbi:MAG: RNA polymerase sigma factor [Coprobacillaceae bacterium]